MYSLGNTDLCSTGEGHYGTFGLFAGVNLLYLGVNMLTIPTERRKLFAKQRRLRIVSDLYTGL
jgi:hypothetical protein